MPTPFLGAFPDVAVLPVAAAPPAHPPRDRAAVVAVSAVTEAGGLTVRAPARLPYAELLAALDAARAQGVRRARVIVEM